MIVAKSRSRLGGKCQSGYHIGPPIKKGDSIYKIGTKGATTQHGQGPGYWVCERCSIEHENHDDGGGS